MPMNLYRKSYLVMRMAKIHKLIHVCVSMSVLLFSQIAVGSECDFNQVDRSRFSIHQNTVLDTQTNLLWQRCRYGLTLINHRCSGEKGLYQLTEIENLLKSSQDGWRLPTVQELYSLAEVNCNQPSLNTEVFPEEIEDNEMANYWTSTPMEEIPSLNYYVNFWDLYVDTHTPGFSLSVRLVKSNHP